MDSPKPSSKSEANRFGWDVAGAIEATFAHSISPAITPELAVVPAAESSVAVRRHFLASPCPLAQEAHTRLASATGTSSQTVTIT